MPDTNSNPAVIPSQPMTCGCQIGVCQHGGAGGEGSSPATLPEVEGFVTLRLAMYRTIAAMLDACRARG